MLTVWEEVQESPLDNETRAQIVGVEAQMANFLSGVSLGALILTHSDNHSVTAQVYVSCWRTAYSSIYTYSSVLKSLCDQEKSDLFFQMVLLDQQHFGISSPSLPHKCYAPQRLQVGSTEGYMHCPVNVYYRVLYFEAIDLVVDAITERFD